MARQSPNGRPIVGQRLNDTVAVVQKGIKPPPAVWESHSLPSPEAMVTGVMEGGARPEEGIKNPSPDQGNTIARTRDYLGRLK
jgi:hypothetical protein